MSFLAPLFLAGALAIALPVIFHLIRRSVKERKVFSSLMFLVPSPPRLTRRSRLEHLLLLLLRCAAIVLLAAGFARPLLQHSLPPDNSPVAAKRLFVLLDTSASMRRQNLWETARKKAEAIIHDASPADAVAVATFDRRFTPLLSFDDWKNTPLADRAALVRSRLADVKPGWAGTALDQALAQAAELIADNLKEEFNGRRQIVLITDFQEGCRMSALQGHEWPKGVEVSLERVLPANPGNAGLQLMTDISAAATTTAENLRVRVSNAADSRQEQFHAVWSAPGGISVGKPVDIYVPPGQSRVVAVQPPPTNAESAHLVLQGDHESFDNDLFVIPPQKVQHTVLYLGTDSESEIQKPFYFLRRAFQNTGRETVRLMKRDPSSPVPPAELEAAKLIIYTGGALGPQAQQLAHAVAGGKTLVFSPATAEAASILGQVLETEPMAMQESQAERYAMLGEIQFRHPLFASFSDSRYSDFTKIHFWKYRRFDAGNLPDARVLARFDSGDSAIIEIPKGKGRVFVLASGWSLADSQLALSSKFVPLLYSLLELSDPQAPPPAQYFVGDTIPIPVVLPSPSIQLPDGSTVQLSAGETNFTRTFMPGLYQVVSASPPLQFAVNVDPAESRTAPMSMDELERFGVPSASWLSTAGANPRAKVRLQNLELESRQKLWRWCLVATLAVLAVETWLAGKTARTVAVTREKNA